MPTWHIWRPVPGQLCNKCHSFSPRCSWIWCPCEQWLASLQKTNRLNQNPAPITILKKSPLSKIHLSKNAIKWVWSSNKISIPFSLSNSNSNIQSNKIAFQSFPSLDENEKWLIKSFSTTANLPSWQLCTTLQHHLLYAFYCLGVIFTYFHKERSAFHTFSTTLTQIKVSHVLAKRTGYEHQLLCLQSQHVANSDISHCEYWRNMLQKKSIKIQWDEEPQVKVGNGVSCRKDSVTFSLMTSQYDQSTKHPLF